MFAFSRIVCGSIFMFALLASGECAFGGKLGRVRSAVSGASNAVPEKTTRSKTAADDEHDHDESSRRIEPTSSTHSRHSQSSSASRKLGRVRAVARHEKRRSPRIPVRSCSGPEVYFNDEFDIVLHPSPVYNADMFPQYNDLQPPGYLGPVSVSGETVEEVVIVDNRPCEFEKLFQIRFEIDYATDEGDVDRSGFGLLFNSDGGLGVDSGVRIFREADADFRDHLWIGDFNVVYELFPTDFIRTRAGVGANWLADREGADAGLNLTVGSDLFAGPLVISGEVDLGTLGDADLFHGRLTAAIRHGDHLEWFGGYDFVDIGGVEIRGIVGGLRFRF